MLLKLWKIKMKHIEISVMEDGEVPEFMAQANAQKELEVTEQIKLLQEQIIDLQKKVEWLEKTTRRISGR